MKTRIIKATMLVFSALAFVVLFYEAKLGLNLVLWEVIVGLLAIILYPPKLKWPLDYALPALFLVSMGTVIFVHTAYAITLNIILFVINVTYLLWPQISMALATLLASVVNVVYGSLHVFRHTFHIKKPKLFNKMPGLGWSLLVFSIVLFFLLLYTSASQHFSQSVNEGFYYLNEGLKIVFEYIHIDVLKWLILGFAFSAALLIRTQGAAIMGLTDTHPLQMQRLRRKSYNPKPYRAYYRFYRFALMLMVMLNLLILYFNTIDIINVWINFKWSGQLLREFVHEGTWLLVFCVGLSVALALLLYGSKIHFFTRNIMLKRLIILWLLQNVIMVISVFIRNYIYIYFYNLAFLRIGVFIFLVCVLIGMLLLLIKMKRGFSMFWLLKNSFMATLIVLSLTSFVNWNRVIAKYNIRHSEDAYFHLDYMVDLPYNTLDILNVNRNLFQAKLDDFDVHEYVNLYQWGLEGSESYEVLLNKRIRKFEEDMQNRDWREWNYSEYRTYGNLMKAEAN